MLEKMRADLAARLNALLVRFANIETAARDQLEDAKFAMRAGVSTGEDAIVFEEIVIKSQEQGDLCAQAISGLLIDRAFPLIFRNGVKRAERFASECEQILASMERARDAGRRAFRTRMGIDI